jgi:hypothetical protein
MESQILVALGFDFVVPNPMICIDRFIHILGYHNNNQVKEMAF